MVESGFSQKGHVGFLRTFFLTLFKDVFFFVRAILSVGNEVEEVDRRETLRRGFGTNLRLSTPSTPTWTSRQGSTLQTFFENNFLACYYLYFSKFQI